MWWLAIILAGCEGTAQPPVECELMVDCGRGEACVSGRCVPIEDAGSQQPSDAEPIDGSTPDVGCNAIEIAGGTSHCTVQEAIDRAMPGDLLRVPAGRFDEAIVISTALTLEGTGAPTILRSISISAANVTVRSLHLESGDGVAIEVQQQGTVEDLEARGTALDGLVVRGSGIADLSGLRLIGMGAHVEAGGTATFSAAVIENAPGTGLLVDDGAVVVLGSASRVSGSTGAGIVVFAADFEMRDSQSLQNGPIGSDIEDGLWLDAPIRSVIERSTFSDNRGYGIFCSAGVVPTVCMGNVFMGNQLGDTNCQGCN